LTAGFICAAKGEKGLGQQGGIAGPLGQAGDLHHDFGQAIPQVFAKPPVGNHRFQVLVRGTDDARVHRDRTATADPLDRAFLQEAQQLDLELQRNVAHFIQEQRAAVGLLDLALGGLHRAGESALFVAEQLAFQQVFRDRGAVDRHKGAAGPARSLVQPARQQFLAGAAGASSMTETLVLATRSIVRATFTISGAAVIMLPSTR
jgi:hypothetical protein